MESQFWQLQSAKAHFSEVVEAATQGKPQRVTRHGKDAVVVVSAVDYDALLRVASANAPSLAQHLLAIPKDKKPLAIGAALRLRNVDF